MENSCRQRGVLFSYTHVHLVRLGRHEATHHLFLDLLISFGRNQYIHPGPRHPDRL